MKMELIIGKKVNKKILADTVINEDDTICKWLVLEKILN